MLTIAFKIHVRIIHYWQENEENLHCRPICNRNDQEDLLKIMGATFGTMLFIGIDNCSSVQPIVDVERPVFYREKAARMYSPIAFALALVRNLRSY